MEGVGELEVIEEQETIHRGHMREVYEILAVERVELVLDEAYLVHASRLFQDISHPTRHSRPRRTDRT